MRRGAFVGARLSVDASKKYEDRDIKTLKYPSPVCCALLLGSLSKLLVLAFRFSVGSSTLMSCGASRRVVGGLGLLLSSEVEDGVKLEGENRDKFCGFTLSMRIGKPEMPPFDCTGANCFCKMSKKSCSPGWAESGLVKSQIAGISEYDSISTNDWDEKKDWHCR